MLKKFHNMSDEMKFIVTLIIAFVIATLVLLLLNKYGKLSGTVLETEQEKKPKPKTVIVSDAEKGVVSSSLPKQVVESVKEAAKQDPMSTAYLQLSRSPQGSPEYEELKHLIESDAKLKKRPDIRKVKEAPTAPMRYLDKSSPRDRSVDALYIYLMDFGAGIWPQLCVQTVGKSQLKANGYSINVDGRQYLFPSLEFKQEKNDKGVAEYYEGALVLPELTAIRALVKSKKAVITFSGASGSRKHEISDEEKKGFERIIDTYFALGGTFDYMRETKKIDKK